jgi:IS5 family transposase
MLIDASPQEDVFARVPDVAAQTDPVLKQLDVLLEDDELYQRVREDLGTRYKQTKVHGRHSTPVEVILRMLICKHLYQWSFKETEERVKDSLVLRWFCRVYFEHVPDETTLVRWLHPLRPETVHLLNDRVVALAKQAKVTSGRKLRLDATCVQTDIHHPTDSGLLVDSVRVLSRVVQRAQPLIQGQVKNLQRLCRSRLRTARRTAQTLHRQLRRKGEDKEAEQKKLHQKLVETSEQMVQQAKHVANVLRKDAQKLAQDLAQQAEEVLPLIERVIFQTRKRVLENKKVPGHKGGALVEFGRQVMLDETEGGIVTRYEILEHPEEHGQAIEAVAHHQQLFARPPKLVAGDRGVHSAETEARLRAAGVKQVAIPVIGQASAERQALERTRAFRRGYRFRAGIQGRIASLRRDYGWRTCLYHGLDGMERWLGLGVLASNLRHIAQHQSA